MTYSNLAFDTVVFILTLIKTVNTSKTAASLGLKGGLYSHFLRSGM